MPLCVRWNIRCNLGQTVQYINFEACQRVWLSGEWCKNKKMQAETWCVVCFYHFFSRVNTSVCHKSWKDEQDSVEQVRACERGCPLLAHGAVYSLKAITLKLLHTCSIKRKQLGCIIILANGPFRHNVTMHHCTLKSIISNGLHGATVAFCCAELSGVRVVCK